MTIGSGVQRVVYVDVYKIRVGKILGLLVCLMILFGFDDLLFGDE